MPPHRPTPIDLPRIPRNTSFSRQRHEREIGETPRTETSRPEGNFVADGGVDEDYSPPDSAGWWGIFAAGTIAGGFGFLSWHSLNYKDSGKVAIDHEKMSNQASKGVRLVSPCAQTASIYVLVGSWRS